MPFVINYFIGTAMPIFVLDLQVRQIAMLECCNCNAHAPKRFCRWTVFPISKTGYWISHKCNPKSDRFSTVQMHFLMRLHLICSFRCFSPPANVFASFHLFGAPFELSRLNNYQNADHLWQIIIWKRTENSFSATSSVHIHIQSHQATLEIQHPTKSHSIQTQRHTTGRPTN